MCFSDSREDIMVSLLMVVIGDRRWYGVLLIGCLQVSSQRGIFYLILVFTLACYKYPGSCQETMVKLTVLISDDHGLCADDSHDALNHDSNHETLQMSQNEMLSYLRMPTTLLYCRCSDSRQEIKMNLMAVKGVLSDVQISDDVHFPHITASCIHISRFLSRDHGALLYDHEKNMAFIQVSDTVGLLQKPGHLVFRYLSTWV
nr:uncharacterized protein LOC110147390 [Odocoileus virginianus texanus]